MEAKICGVKDKKILNFIVSHKYAPKFIGFICNYPKSHRNLSLEKLKSDPLNPWISTNGVFSA